MNQEKIGKFIAKIRHEKNLTQQELANKLGVTDRAISNWENGRRLPDYSIIIELCNILEISLNELFAGEKIKKEKFKQKADENLLFALENSSFNLKDKIKFYKNKWKKDNLSKIIICFISWIVLIISLKFQQVDFYLIGSISGMLAILFYITLYNQMMKYVEDNAYGKKSNISIEELENSIKRLNEFKQKMNKFDEKKEAINYLVSQTDLSKQECIEAYDFIMKLDLDKIK